MRKIQRDAFLYFDNKEKKGDFAQCGSCALLDEAHWCELFSKKVNLNDTCGLYIPGERGTFERKRTNGKALLSLKEGDFLDKTQVRCENCFYGGEICKLFDALNRNATHFDLDTKISPKGCCNAWTPK